MAIAPTGAIYKSLIFDGEDSRDYGVYITGEAVYNAPERDVEMIAIPGRNGAYALDNGRFENIEVMYPAGIYADNETDFAEAISDFRNFLCSKKGYCRLEDEYNPNEYRMAVYRSGLEVSPTQLKTGEFEIIFECKPQRWLTSGESAVTVTSGDTLTNPTLFESGPLLAVKGYGTIEFNGYEIELRSGDYGDVTILNDQKFWENNYSITIPSEYIKNGDTITISGLAARAGIILGNGYSFNYSGPNQAPNPTDLGTAAVTTYANRPDGPLYGTNACTGMTRFVDIVFTIGTNGSISHSYTIDDIAICQWISGTKYDKGTTDITVTTTVAYDAATQTITFTQSGSATGNAVGNITFRIFGQYSSSPSTIGSLVVNSTITYLGNPTYIDCDLGEAYKDENGTIISLNSYIDLGSDLPKLASGSNTVTYDNTITDLKVTPGWWKI